MWYWPPVCHPTGWALGTVLWVQSAIAKAAEYLGRNDPRVSGIPHSLAESLQDVARDEMLLPGEVYKKCILW